MGEPTLKWSYPPSTVDPSSPSTNSVGKFLYNNAFVFDSSAPATHANGDPILDSNGNPAVPLTNYKKTRQYLENHSRGCIREKSEISIIEKIELSNKKGLEQNNFIYNIGSPLNAYILKIIF